MNTKNINAQMELSFGTRSVAARRVPPRKRARASWWFARMRDAVDQAWDWHAAPAGRPEQIWMLGLFRQPAGATSKGKA